MQCQRLETNAISTHSTTETSCSLHTSSSKLNTHIIFHRHNFLVYRVWLVLGHQLFFHVHVTSRQILINLSNLDSRLADCCLRWWRFELFDKEFFVGRWDMRSSQPLRPMLNYRKLYLTISNICRLETEIWNYVFCNAACCCIIEKTSNFPLFTSHSANDKNVRKNWVETWILPNPPHSSQIRTLRHSRRFRMKLTSTCISRNLAF